MKKVKVKVTFNDLYNKLITSNVPTYLVSSQEQINVAALKPLKANKETILLMTLKNKTVSARKGNVILNILLLCREKYNPVFVSAQVYMIKFYKKYINSLIKIILNLDGYFLYINFYDRIKNA